MSQFSIHNSREQEREREWRKSFENYLRCWIDFQHTKKLPTNLESKIKWNYIGGDKWNSGCTEIMPNSYSSSSSHIYTDSGLLCVVLFKLNRLFGISSFSKMNSLIPNRQSKCISVWKKKRLTDTAKCKYKNWWHRTKSTLTHTHTHTNFWIKIHMQLKKSLSERAWNVTKVISNHLIFILEPFCLNPRAFGSGQYNNNLW